jgi:ribonuclease D
MKFIDRSEQVASLGRTLAAAPLLALDTEAAGYHRYHDRLCVVQVSTREETFVIDALAAEIAPLGEVFASGANETILHDADFDLRLLGRDHGIRVANLFDTKVAAQLLGETTLGLAGLVEKHLGVRLDKKHQRADWARRPLPAELIEYAGEDTRHLPSLRDMLRSRLVELDRLRWAQEEFRLREAMAPSPSENGAGWQRIKNTRDLTPRQYGALRELFLWRDEVARERDVAPFRVLANETLVMVARNMPAGNSALAALDGITPLIVSRHGADLLNAVERARRLPEIDLPVRARGPRRPPPDPQFDALVERLRGVRDRVADEIGLERGFLMPRQQLEEIARRKPEATHDLRDVPDIRAWQIEVMGDALLDALGR